MKKILLLLIICNCISKPIAPLPIKTGMSHADSISVIDTAYIDPVTGHIRPPCSMSPAYCACMKNRGINACQ
jgi:hypothetical protein